MKYAVVQSGGKQYIAKVGEIVTIDKIEKKVGDKFEFENILLIKNENTLEIGKPNLEAGRVTGTVLKQYKGEKLDVFKFKAKVRYRKKIGFRPLLTDIKIDKIESH